jgi:hypothetical protein
MTGAYPAWDLAFANETAFAGDFIVSLRQRLVAYKADMTMPVSYKHY